MVTPPRLTSNQPAQQRRPGTAAAFSSKKGQEGCTGLVAIVGFIMFVILVGKCSSSPDTSASGLANVMDSNISAGVAAQALPKVEPLNSGGIARGIAHFRLAYRAEGAAGAMVYSQNCYDALVHKFGWTKLDTCGAFDMLAVRAMDEAEPAGPGGEPDYFQSEAAAGRYLAAATGAGEASSEADKRLGDLQSKVGGGAAPGPPPHANQPHYETGSGALAGATPEGLRPRFRT
jgi:hypothetical protein